MAVNFKEEKPNWKEKTKTGFMFVGVGLMVAFTVYLWWSCLGRVCYP